MTSSRRIDWAALRARLAESSDGASRRDDAATLRRRTDRYQTPLAAEPEPGTEVVVFVRDGVRYGIPLIELNEIRNRARISPLPGVSDVIRGLVHVRGQVLAVHDLAAFGGSRARVDEPWLLLGCGEARSVALLADDVEGITELNSSQIHPLPLHLAHLEPAFLGVSDTKILLISLLRLIDNPTFFDA